ncbi:hypothetical protein KGMB02408_06730 [Bacteroides faecalis]|uniref:Uncharacterized protein n=1 Tax=Bacteroides faecalis TaxID=2447885 RepID=A0A401LQA0_9BACE|nr:hypothetical protein KGMB02408_06730 [Bacteroides faecalis]
MLSINKKKKSTIYRLDQTASLKKEAMPFLINLIDNIDISMTNIYITNPK